MAHPAWGGWPTGTELDGISGDTTVPAQGDALHLLCMGWVHRAHDLALAHGPALLWDQLLLVTGVEGWLEELSSSPMHRQRTAIPSSQVLLGQL